MCASWTFHHWSSSESCFSLSSADQDTGRRTCAGWSGHVQLKQISQQSHTPINTPIQTDDTTRSASDLSPESRQRKGPPAAWRSAGHPAGTCYLSALCVSWKRPQLCVPISFQSLTKVFETKGLIGHFHLHNHLLIMYMQAKTRLLCSLGENLLHIQAKLHLCCDSFPQFYKVHRNIGISASFL